MPIVRIELIEGKSEEYRTQVGEIVYQTLVDVLNAFSSTDSSCVERDWPSTFRAEPGLLGLRSLVSDKSSAWDGQT
jgi:Tautomerase enzyme